MERQRIDDEHIVARYLAGQLDEAEAAAFEKHYENDRDVVREIERTLRMKEGLAVLNERGQLDALMRPRTAWKPALALAAGLAMVVVGVLLWVGQATVGPIAGTIAALGERNGQPLQVVSTYVLARTRGTPPTMAVALPKDGGALELRMIPSSRARSGDFRVTIAQLDAADAAAPLGETRAGQSSEDGFVTAYLDSSKLARGRYRVELLPERPETAGAPADRFILELH